MRTLRPGSDDEATYGPMTMASQIDIVRRHIEDADARRRPRASRGDATEPVAGENFLAPTVLLDVPEDSAAVPRGDLRADADDHQGARRRGGARAGQRHAYGLAGSVFSKSKARGLDLARRMRSGMTSVNSVLTFASVPALPFGGVGDSGFGRIHGEDGLKEFTRAKAITRQRFALPVNLMSFGRPANAADAARPGHGHGPRAAPVSERH